MPVRKGFHEERRLRKLTRLSLRVAIVVSASITNRNSSFPGRGLRGSFRDRLLGDQEHLADVLAALLERHVRNVMIAGICDQPATDACYRAGVGKTLPLSVGATLDPKASKPVKVTGKVRFLSHMDDPLGRQAVIETEGISVVVTERRRPFHHIKDFTSLGLEPTKFKIVVVKAGYLEPEINKIANPNLMANGTVRSNLQAMRSHMQSMMGSLQAMINHMQPLQQTEPQASR